MPEEWQRLFLVQVDLYYILAEVLDLNKSQVQKVDDVNEFVARGMTESYPRSSRKYYKWCFQHKSFFPFSFPYPIQKEVLTIRNKVVILV